MGVFCDAELPRDITVSIESISHLKAMVKWRNFCFICLLVYKRRGDKKQSLVSIFIFPSKLYIIHICIILFPFNQFVHCFKFDGGFRNEALILAGVSGSKSLTALFSCLGPMFSLLNYAGCGWGVIGILFLVLIVQFCFIGSFLLC